MMGLRLTSVGNGWVFKRYSLLCKRYSALFKRYAPLLKRYSTLFTRYSTSLKCYSMMLYTCSHHGVNSTRTHANLYPIACNSVRIASGLYGIVCECYRTSSTHRPADHQKPPTRPQKKPKFPTAGFLENPSVGKPLFWRTPS